MNHSSSSQESSISSAGPTLASRAASSKENNSASSNKPRYMQMTAGEKQRRQSMLVKPSVSTASLKKRPPLDKGGSAPPRPPKHEEQHEIPPYHPPAAPSLPQTPTVVALGRGRQGADDNGAEAEVLRLSVELKRMAAELQEAKDENAVLKAKLSDVESERDQLRHALQGEQRGEGAFAWQGLAMRTQGAEGLEGKVQATVGAYCRETDERMKKLHQLIEKLQTHLHHQPPSN